MKVHQTLSGQSEKILNISLNWCNSKNVKLGEMAIIYQLDQDWYLKHDEFAISEATSILTTEAINRSTGIASY